LKPVVYNIKQHGMLRVKVKRGPFPSFFSRASVVPHHSEAGFFKEWFFWEAIEIVIEQ
jgi:hypothetical protein